MIRINELIMTKFAEGRAFLLLFMAISFTACERNFPNLNAPIVEDVPIQSLVTGAESGMRVDLAIYLRVVSVVGREAYYFEPADPRYSGDLLRGVPDPGGFLVDRPWRARYRTISNCNALLDKSQEAGVQGFAKTILAYQFLLNLNYLDENGIQLDLSGNLAPFASKTQAFARIAALLDEANTSLAAAGSGFSFNLTSGFAGFNTPSGFRQFNRALKARVSVYRGMFNEAQTALGESFMSPIASLDLGVYHIYGTGLADQGNEIFENPSASFVKFLAHPTFGTNAEAGDMRFSSKTFLRADATTFDNLTSNLAVTVTSNSTDALPIIRNEELILLSAEAKIGLGDYSGAEMDMNIVRAAAGLAGYTGTDATNALDRLLHEKRYSLFLEGHRWVDMRRYGRLNQLPIDRPTDVALDKMPIPEDEVGG